MHEILTELAIAQKALRESTAAFHSAVQELIVVASTLMDRAAEAQTAQSAVLDAVIAATARALEQLPPDDPDDLRQ